MRTIQAFVILCLFFLFTSCESVEKSDKTAEEFYAAIKDDNFDKAVSFCSEEALKANPKEEWIALLKARKEKTGKLLSFQRYAFETKTNNGVTKTELKYNVTYEKMKFYEKLIFISSGSEYKLERYAFAETEDQLKDL